MKKIIVLILTAMCLSSALAVNGSYIGVGLGYSNVIFDINYNAQEVITGLGSHKAFHGSCGGFNTQWTVGYAYDIKNKFRLGAEVIAQMPNVNRIDNSSSDNSYTYEFNNAYGINLVPGYYLTADTLGYLKLGVTRGKFLYKNVSNTQYPITNASFHSTGLSLGLGIATYLSKNVSLKIEYVYTNYAPQRFYDDIIPEDLKEIIVHTKIRPEIHTAMLGLDYQFNWF